MSEYKEGLDLKSQLLGEHEARLDSLDRSVSEIAADVKAIRAYMDRAKGSWKMLVLIGGVTTAFVEGMHEFVAFLHNAGHH